MTGAALLERRPIFVVISVCESVDANATGVLTLLWRFPFLPHLAVVVDGHELAARDGTDAK